MLGLNTETGAFYLLAGTPELVALAGEVGLDRSLPASARRGQPVFVTHSPYAALPFWDHADAAARDALLVRRLEYEESYAVDYEGASIPCPPDRDYMPFQKAGVRYATSRGDVLVGDQPGLGKTIEAVGVANSIGAERVLVVCPASVRLQWEKEIRAWSTIRRCSAYPILRSADGVNPFANYTIVSYDLARAKGIYDALLAHEYDLLVLDEAHYLKSTDARRSRAVLGALSGAAYDPTSGSEGRVSVGGAHRGCLSDRATKVLALTGTPLPNRPRECYNLARHFCWDAIDWITEDRFKALYNPSFQMPSGKVIEKQGRLPELRARLRCNLMVRRLKKQVLTQLPDEQYELTYVEPSGAVRKVLKAESLLEIDPDHLENMSMTERGHISTIRRLMGVAKAPLAAGHVAMLLEGGLDKVVVFAHHREVVSILEEKLKSYGVVVVDGRTSPGRRESRKLQFMGDPGTKVFLANLESGGTGVDGLQTVCQHMVFAEASWVPKDNEQCVDRLHRMGQSGSVLAQFLVAPGSFDEYILGRAIQKMGAIHETLDKGVL